MVGVISSKYELNYQMAVGRGKVLEEEDTAPRVETHMNEHGQLWTYRVWADFMSAPTWDDLRRNHSKPEGYV
jgi:hypothetical protein